MTGKDKTIQKKKTVHAGMPERKKIGQLPYAICVLVTSVVYGLFYWYTKNHMDILYQDIVSLHLSTETKYIIVLSVLFIVVWALLFSVSVWRGNDIGLEKWQSRLLYLVHILPRFSVMFFGLEGSLFDAWAEVVAGVIWVITVGIFIYLPEDWVYTAKGTKRQNFLQ